jgi:hypothetical protein
MEYYRDWRIDGPIVASTISGKPAAYVFWTGHDLVIGRRYHDRDFIGSSREAVIDHINVAAEYDEEPAAAIPWGLRQNRDGFWQAFARIRRGLEPIYARAQTTEEAEAKLRTRLASLRYFPDGPPTL